MPHRLRREGASMNRSGNKSGFLLLDASIGIFLVSLCILLHMSFLKRLSSINNNSSTYIKALFVAQSIAENLKIGTSYPAMCTIDRYKVVIKRSIHTHTAFEHISISITSIDKPNKPLIFLETGRMI